MSLLMKYETKIRLNSSYFDLNDRLTAKAILEIFQDVASIHAEEIGVGYLSMLERNLYWIVSRIKFDIIKMPQAYQTVIVQTWPHEKGKIDFDRDMKILSEDGEELIIATSKWCVIDVENRKLQRAEHINYNGEVISDKNYEEKFTKLNMEAVSLLEKFIYTVGFSDLDHNKHMNNTHYASLILNAINNKIFNHFEINFNNEAVENDKICVSLGIKNNEEYIVGKTEEKIIFTAMVK